LTKTNINRAGLINLDKIIENSGRHRDYYLSYELYKDYRSLLEENLKQVVSCFEESYISINNLFSDSFKRLKGASFIKEENPRLGIHGIRYGLKYLEMLDAEIMAIKNSLEGKEGGILVPFVTNPSEYKEFKEILRSLNFDKKVGVIIDNPSSIQLVKDYINYGVDFVVLDFDKILESLLMVDLKNENFPKFFNFNNSAVFNQMEYLIRVCKRNNVGIKVKFSSLDESVFSFFIKKEVDSFLAGINFYNDLSGFVKDIEKELIEGTDREPREYETKREKEERNLDNSSDEKSLEEIKENKSENETEGNLEKNNEESSLKEESLEEDEKVEKEEEEKSVGSEYSVEDLINSKNKEHEELKEEGEELESKVEDIFQQESGEDKEKSSGEEGPKEKEGEKKNQLGIF
jgi:hypothetical protein